MVIVVHNAGELLRPVVDQAVAQAGMDQVWVMDAESTDGSAAAIAGSIPPGHLRAVPNKGFSASNNRGIELTSSPFVLLLNPDAVLRKGALDALLESAKRNPRAGIIGPAILNPDGSAQANAWGRFPSLWSFLWLRVWRFAKRVRGNRQLSPRIPTHTKPVDWVTGACMLVRRAAIEDVGHDGRGVLHLLGRHRVVPPHARPRLAGARGAGGLGGPLSRGVGGAGRLRGAGVPRLARPLLRPVRTLGAAGRRQPAARGCVGATGRDR